MLVETESESSRSEEVERMDRRAGSRHRESQQRGSQNAVAELAKAVSPAKAKAKAVKAAVKQIKAGKSIPHSKFSLSDQKQAAVDRAVRACAGKAAVECMLKSSLNPKWNTYQYFGLSNGEVVHVNVGEEISAHLIPEDRKTVKDWRRKQAQDAKRAEAKAKK